MDYNGMQQDMVTQQHPTLELPIEDSRLLATLDQIEHAASIEKGRLNIDTRAKLVKDFWRGEQVDNSKVEPGSISHVDNVTFRNTEGRIKLASGKVPDIFVSPADEKSDSIEAAKKIQKALRAKMDSSTIKRIIKKSLRNMELDLLGVIKPRWNALTGDFTFEVIKSRDMLFSAGAKIPDDGFTIDGTDVTVQYVEEPTNLVLAKFPDKSAELMSFLGTKFKGNIPARIKYTETHFTYYGDNGYPFQGVAWRYMSVLLGKMKEPYYNYEKEENNFFDRPRKPYILVSYINDDDGVYETTTSAEQLVAINRMINKRRRQISEINDRTIPKLIFKGGSYSQEQAETISVSNKQAIITKENTEVDDLRKEVMALPAQPANPILYNDMVDLRGQADATSSTHGTVRGESQGESGISKQISREGDLVTSDDIVDIVVERIVQEMSAWAIQFMKLYYTDDREPISINKADDRTEFVRLNREIVTKKISLSVKASTTDAATRRANAMQMVSSKTIDPYTLMEDLDVPNPAERTKRVISFMKANAAGDFAEYLKTVDVDQEVDNDMSDAEQALTDIELIKQGIAPEVEKVPNSNYVAELMKFKNDPSFATLSPEAQAMFEQHMQKLRTVVEDMAQGAQQQGMGQPGGQPPMGEAPAPQPQPEPQPAPQPQMQGAPQ